MKTHFLRFILKLKLLLGVLWLMLRGNSANGQSDTISIDNYITRMCYVVSPAPITLMKNDVSLSYKTANNLENKAILLSYGLNKRWITYTMEGQISLPESIVLIGPELMIYPFIKNGLNIVINIAYLKSLQKSKDDVFHLSTGILFTNYSCPFGFEIFESISTEM